MSAVNRATDTFERVIPVVLVAAIALVGYFWFAQPRIAEYLTNRNEIRLLETQVRGLQDEVNRGRGVAPVDEAAALRLFDERVSTDDKVSEIVETLAKAALDSAPKGQVRGLQIQTGESQPWRPGPAQARTGDAASEAPDPRMGLFPVPVTYTPVTVSFESSYAAISRFVWRLRDMPTLIEIQSMDLARGLPYMKARLRILVYQRGEAPSGPGVAAPGPAASPVVPRVAGLSTAEGW